MQWYADMIDSVDFAKYIMKRAAELSVQLNLTKLNKILYVCDGTLLALGKNIINERAKAWDFGPVYPRVYKWYLRHKDEDFTGWFVPSAIKDDNVIKVVVEQALKKFGGWSTAALSEWTHKEGSPWSLTMKESGEKLNSAISKDYMKLYFSGLVGD